MKPNVAQAVKEIQSINIEKDSSMESIYKLFYAVCEKYNIKQGTQIYDDSGKGVSVIQNTFEWTICKDALNRTVHSTLTFFDLLNEVPESIQCYKKEDNYEAPI